MQYLIMQLTTSFLVFLWCLWQRLRLRQHFPGHLLTAVMAVWACWQLLFGPGSERLTYGLVAPFVALGVMISYSKNRHRLWIMTAWIGLVLFGSGDIEMTFAYVLPFASMLLPLSVMVFASWLSSFFSVI